MRVHYVAFDSQQRQVQHRQSYQADSGNRPASRHVHGDGDPLWHEESRDSDARDSDATLAEGDTTGSVSYSHSSPSGAFEEVEAGGTEAPPAPASTAKIYKRLKGLFDGKPIHHDLPPTVSAVRRAGRAGLVACHRAPSAAFAISEFTTPLSGEDVMEPAAALLAECIRRDAVDSPVDVVVSAATRGCGALTQAVAFSLDVPYSLAHMDADVAPDSLMVNGLPAKSRVAIVLDVVRTGTTAARLVEGIRRVAGCTVLGVYTVAATVMWKVPVGTPNPTQSECSTRHLPSMTPAAPAPVQEEDPRLNGYYHSVNDRSHAGHRAATNADGNSRHSLLLAPPPPLRALFMVSLAGERTHVLTVREREAESLAAMQHDDDDDAGPPQHAAALSVPPRRKWLQGCLASQYAWCFPTECPPPRRLPCDVACAVRRMPAAELQRKQRRVTNAFVGAPAVVREGSACGLFALTHFSPALHPSLVEDMADLAVLSADLRRCEVLVSPGSAGSGGAAPLLHAISLRTHQPYIVASTTAPCGSFSPASFSCFTHSTGDTAASHAGHVRLAGLQPGVRWALVDCTLDSGGGSVESVLRCMTRHGATPVEAVFAAEELRPPQPQPQQGGINTDRAAGSRLPVRVGRNRLAGSFPEVRVTCLSQYVVQGDRTVAPPCRVGD